MVSRYLNVTKSTDRRKDNLMGNIVPGETKMIPAESWVDWFDTFTAGNAGRPVRIALVDDELGNEALTSDAPLVAIDYDPVGKGNDFVISYGDKLAPSHHTIQVPTALWQAQDDNGLVVSLEIEDESGRRTILSF
jgi:hypothetical protein